MAQTSITQRYEPKNAPPDATRDRRVFELALGGKDKLARYMQLMNKAEYGGYTFGTAASNGEIIELKYYCQQIINYVRANYAKPAIHNETGELVWIGNQEYQELRAGGREVSIETKLCFLPILSKWSLLPPLPESGWKHFLDHVESVQKRYGSENFRLDFLG